MFSLWASISKAYWLLTYSASSVQVGKELLALGPPGSGVFPATPGLLPELSRPPAAESLPSGPGEAFRILLAHPAAVMSSTLLCFLFPVNISPGTGNPGGMRFPRRKRVRKLRPWPLSAG